MMMISIPNYTHNLDESFACPSAAGLGLVGRLGGAGSERTLKTIGRAKPVDSPAGLHAAKSIADPRKIAVVELRLLVSLWPE